MAFKAGDGGSVSDINVTPLVDVMLVLLIIFMVAAAAVKQDIDEQERLVDLNLPLTDPDAIVRPSDDKLIFQIDASLQISLDNTPILDCSAALASTADDRFESCFLDIQNQIELHERAQADGRLYILADPTIPYGFVVGAMHRIRLAGIDSVGLVTNPEFLAGVMPATE